MCCSPQRSDTERRSWQDWLTLMKDSSVVSLPSHYFIFAVYRGFVPSGRTFAETVSAGVWVVLCTQSSSPVFQVCLLHTLGCKLHLSLYCNAKPKAQLCFTVDQTASVHIIFSCTYILVPKGSEYVCSIACITWGIGEKWKILSPHIQVDLEWLRLGQEIWLFKLAFQKILMDAKAQEPLFSIISVGLGTPVG